LPRTGRELTRLCLAAGMVAVTPADPIG